MAEIERVRGNMGSGPLNSAYLTAKSEVYADLALVLLWLGRDDEAFAVADGVRAKALLKQLPSIRSRVESEEARDLIEQERLLRRIDALITKLGEVNETEPEERGPETSATASELAAQARISLPGALKHVRILEEADLVTSEKKGRTRECRLGPAQLEDATAWIEWYRSRWERRLDRIEALIDKRKGGPR